MSYVSPIKFSLLCLLFFVSEANAQVIKSIQYKGNNKTKESVLNNIITAKTGQVLDSLVLDLDTKLLSRLAVCNKAEYKLKEDKDGNYEVTYIFYETNTIIPAISIWTASNEQFSYQLGVKEFNFLGKNKEIGFFYRNNGFHSFSFNYKDPTLFNETTGLGLAVQSLKSLEPIFLEERQIDYEYTNSSVEVYGIKKITPFHKAKLGLSFFKEDYKIYDNQLLDNTLPDNVNIDNLMMRMGFEYNKLTFSEQYLEGFKSDFNGQLVFPFGDTQPNYFVLINDFLYYNKIRTKGNFATRTRLGLASEVSTPFAPFSLDNNLNIRGVGNVIDRGTAAVVVNTEYRHTLYEKGWLAIQSNVFIDAGSWRQPRGKLSDILTTKNLRIHPGAGLRFIHKKIYNAVLRLDYGFGIVNEKQQGIVFGIGQYF
ncbi:POTRA domain-containing protein [Wenyingzhuangia sp. IMCC45533]